MITQAQDKLTAAWTAAGRAGRPRTMALFYFALGPGAEKMAADSLGGYYAFLGDNAQQVVASAATDAQTVRQYLAGFAAAGTDDVICFPASADLSQVDRLAEAAVAGARWGEPRVVLPVLRRFWRAGQEQPTQSSGVLAVTTPVSARAGKPLE